MSRHQFSILGVLAVGVVVAAVGLGSVARAQQPPTVKMEPLSPISSVDGKENYTAYCAVCHGTDGTGNGPAAPALKMAAPDLTTLAWRNHGEFDAIKIQRLVAGSDRMPVAHGTVDMPMWGPAFHEAQPNSAMATLRITNLVKYLESIQRTTS